MTVWTVINNSCKPRPSPVLSCFQIPFLSFSADVCSAASLLFSSSLLSTFIFVQNTWHSNSQSSSSFEHTKGWETTLLVICCGICCYQKIRNFATMKHYYLMFNSWSYLILHSIAAISSSWFSFLPSLVPSVVFCQTLTCFYIPISPPLFLSLLPTLLSFSPWFYPWFFFLLCFPIRPSPSLSRIISSDLLLWHFCAPHCRQWWSVGKNAFNLKLPIS